MSRKNIEQTSTKGRPSSLSRAKLELLARRLKGEGKSGPNAGRIPRRAPDAGPPPLSFAQERLWFLAQLEPDNPNYNTLTNLRLSGRLNVSLPEQVIGEVTRRHEALRTTFGEVEGRVSQIIHPAASERLSLVDLSDLSPEARKAQARKFVNEWARRPLNLARERPLRLALLRIEAEEHVILQNAHHIAWDAWSAGLFGREAAALQGAYAAGRPSPLAEPPIQYADFAMWQREWMAGEALEEQLAYWRRHLEGAPPVLELPTDRPRPPIQTYSGRSQGMTLSAELAGRIRALAQTEGATLFMALLAAFDAMLYRHTGQTDVVVGVPIANRNRVEVEGVIGFFVNTLVLRARLDGDPTFRELLRRVSEATIGAYAHQDLPFERLVKELKPQRSLSHSPLFQVFFSVDNTPRERPQFSGLRQNVMRAGNDAAKFDLSFLITDGAGDLSVGVEYNRDLFDDETIARLLGHFRAALESVVEDADRRVSALPLLAPEELRQLLVEWNDTRAEFDTRGAVHELFERQAARTPDSVALVWEGEQLTYRGLNRRANRLARSLRRLGVGPERLVGVMLERSPELVVSLLGTLKAGGAYVPLDPEYPAERLAFMAEDAALRALLTERKLVERLPQTSGASVIAIDGRWPEIERESGDDLPATSQGFNAAYVIYTSGSTGRPKGVIIESHSALTLLHWARSYYTDAQLARTLASTSVCFDLSVFELFAPLSWGGAIVLAENALRLPELPAAQSVTLINTVPSAMTEIVSARLAPSSVTTVNLAGEALKNQLAQQIYEMEGIERVINLYGPSEDTTYSTVALVRRGDAAEPTIGRPISNTQIYLLDRHFQPAPVRGAGELYIGGEGVARGYLNRPELTAERFMPNPFSAEPGTRLYRTGDLARFRRDGEIEYLGRADHQVKIRGFRIELGEIEAALGRHPSVNECVLVAARESDGTGHRLVAYYTGAASESELRDYLRERLPSYMTPGVFMQLERLPLTPNGKVDRKALPAPEREAGAEFVAPRNAVEETVAGIWREALGLERVSVDANFFDLGGHSLLVMRVISRLREAFHVEAPARLLFEAPTVAGVAQAIAGMTDGAAESFASDDAALDLYAEAELDSSIRPRGPAEATRGPAHIFLTGSTGFLGAFLLRDLLRETGADIYCLVRAADADDGLLRIRAALENYELWEESFSARIRPVTGDLSQPLFGLTPERFSDIARRIDVIYHNGATVNFILPYARLKPANVLGVQEALRLACAEKTKPVHYVSTISVFRASPGAAPAVFNENDEPRPETLSAGYPRSKWVAERLAKIAGERGLPVTIYRPGVIVGDSRTGAINADDFSSRYIRTCLQIGAYPQGNDVIAAVPVDFVSRAILKISRRPRASGEVYHLVNPKMVAWSEVVEWLRGAGHPLKATPYARWRSEIERRPECPLYALLPSLPPGKDESETVTLSETPEPLLSVVFDCRNTIAALADTELSCPPFGPESLEKSLDYLRRRGLLEPRPAPPLRPIPRGEELPLSFKQERL
jgi:amino acid adenylation domain-containing protein/thioester reductase-like protein